MTKAIILDMDGLLIDSEPFWREVEIRAFTKVGVPINEKRALETTGLRVDEVAEYGKPHPGVYITVAEKLGVDPTECVAFEDSINGVLAAKAAKMRCIAVPDPLVKDRKEFCIADLVLDSLEEVTKEMIIR